MNAKSVLTTLTLATLLCLCIFAQGQSDGKGQGNPPAETPAQGYYLHPWDFVQVDLDKTNNKEPEPWRGANTEAYITAQALRSNPSVQGIIAVAKHWNDWAPRVLTSELKDPRGMATDGQCLYVADGGADGVYRVDKDGNTALVASGIKDPRYLTMDDKGNLYVSAAKTAGKGSSKGGGNTGQGIVYKIVRGGSLPWVVKPFAEGFHDPRGVSWWDNILYVADSLGDNGKVYKLAGGTKTLVAEGFHRIEGIDVDACGNIYVAHGEGNHGKVEVIFPDGYRTLWKEDYGALRGLKVYESDIWPNTDQVGTTDWKNSTVESLSIANLRWTNTSGTLEAMSYGTWGILRWGEAFIQGVLSIQDGDYYVLYRSTLQSGPWEAIREQVSATYEFQQFVGEFDENTPPIEFIDWTGELDLLAEDFYPDKDIYFLLEHRRANGELAYRFEPVRTIRFTCGKGKPLPFVEGAGTQEANPTPAKSLQKINQNVALTQSETSDLGVEWPCGQTTPCIPEYDREWLKNEDITTIRMTREGVGRKLAGSFLSLETPLRDVDGLLIQNITIHGQPVNNYADLLYVEAIAHGVNPEVLLALIEKESSAIGSKTRPGRIRLAHLSGWCPKPKEKWNQLIWPTEPFPVEDHKFYCDPLDLVIDWAHTIRGQTHWAARQLELNQRNAGLRCRDVRTTDGGVCVKPGTVATGSMFYYNPEVGWHFNWGPNPNVGGSSRFYQLWLRWEYGKRLQDWVFLGDRNPEPDSTTSETKPEISAVARSCDLVSRAGARECPRPTSDYAAIDDSSITENNITLTSEDGATVNITDLAVTPVENTGEKRFKISFKPAEDLESGKTYKVEIKNVKDELGNPGSTDWSFKVEVKPKLVQPILTNVSISFDERKVEEPYDTGWVPGYPVGTTIIYRNRGVLVKEYRENIVHSISGKFHNYGTERDLTLIDWVALHGAEQGSVELLINDESVPLCPWIGWICYVRSEGDTTPWLTWEIRQVGQKWNPGKYVLIQIGQIFWLEPLTWVSGIGRSAISFDDVHIGGEGPYYTGTYCVDGFLSASRQWGVKQKVDINLRDSEGYWNPAIIQHDDIYAPSYESFFYKDYIIEPCTVENDKAVSDQYSSDCEELLENKDNFLGPTPPPIPNLLPYTLESTTKRNYVAYENYWLKYYWKIDEPYEYGVHVIVNPTSVP